MKIEGINEGASEEAILEAISAGVKEAFLTAFRDDDYEHHRTMFDVIKQGVKEAFEEAGDLRKDL